MQCWMLTYLTTCGNKSIVKSNSLILFCASAVVAFIILFSVYLPLHKAQGNITLDEDIEINDTKYLKRQRALC